MSDNVQGLIVVVIGYIATIVLVFVDRHLERKYGCNDEVGGDDE